jgi:predicted DNA-binding protein
MNREIQLPKSLTNLLTNMQLDKITSIRLYQGDNAELQKIADLKGLDRADIIRAAVKSYIQEYKSQLLY